MGLVCFPFQQAEALINMILKHITAHFTWNEVSSYSGRQWISFLSTIHNHKFISLQSTWDKMLGWVLLNNYFRQKSSRSLIPKKKHHRSNQMSEQGEERKHHFSCSSPQTCYCNLHQAKPATATKELLTFFRSHVQVLRGNRKSRLSENMHLLASQECRW